MQLSPDHAAFALFALLIVLSSAWRRGRIRKARRDLPTAMQRLLGPEPLFIPPSQERLPEGLRAYAALHLRTRWIQAVLWALAFAWGAFIVISVLRGPLP